MHECTLDFMHPPFFLHPSSHLLFADGLGVVVWCFCSRMMWLLGLSSACSFQHPLLFSHHCPVHCLFLFPAPPSFLASLPCPLPLSFSSAPFFSRIAALSTASFFFQRPLLFSHRCPVHCLFLFPAPPSFLTSLPCPLPLSFSSAPFFSASLPCPLPLSFSSAPFFSRIAALSTASFFFQRPLLFSHRCPVHCLFLFPAPPSFLASLPCPLSLYFLITCPVHGLFPLSFSFSRGTVFSSILFFPGILKFFL